MSQNNVTVAIVEKPNFLMEHEGAQLLKELGLPVAQSRLVTSKQEAVQFAESIGYPVVMKGMSRDIVHKTEAGIVKLNMSNPIEVETAFAEIIENASNYNKHAEMAGILVQKMAPKGTELIFGVKKDPVFGHQLVIGFGGIFVEIMKDFAMRMMPVTVEDVEEMLQELKTYPIIKGYRGQAGLNRKVIADICLGLNELIEQRPEIEELDLNPVIFAGQDAFICDVRILLGEEQVTARTQKSLENVKRMIDPRSIAVIGASTNEKKNGGRLLRYLVENNYPGKIFPINPGASEIKGYKAYPNLRDVPEEIDLVCIIVEAKHVPQVMEDCIAKGVKAAIIYSSGFAEVGDEGKKLQEQVLALAEKGNIHCVGS